LNFIADTVASVVVYPIGRVGVQRAVFVVQRAVLRVERTILIVKGAVLVIKRTVIKIESLSVGLLNKKDKLSAS
jgi:hypothetical protein